MKVEKIEFLWNSRKIKPRVDVSIVGNNKTNRLTILDYRFNYPFRETINCLTRHYKMPMRFHFPFFRKRFERKVKEILEE